MWPTGPLLLVPGRITAARSVPGSEANEANTCGPQISREQKTKFVTFSPQANSTDWATAASRQIYCQLLRLEDCEAVRVTGPSRQLILAF
jgi:hypothetical protein